MSTRTNIVVQYGTTNIFIYRHYDGYPGETGGDLVEKLRAHPKVEDFVAALLTERYEKQYYETEPKRTYELTTDLHGDIEWLYVVRFFHAGGCKVAAGLVKGEANEERVLQEVQENLRTIADLAKLVNQERREMNARLLELKAKYPGSAYANCEPYPMLEVA